MIYEFNLPHITDTKNIKKCFLNKKFVTQENMPLLDKAAISRTRFRENMKYLIKEKKGQKVPDVVYEEIKNYANNISVIHQVFENDYDIKKNWKWSPLFSTQSVLKFGKRIFYGKSGEILMARYCGFVTHFKQVKTQLDFCLQNYEYVEGQGAGDNLNFSVIKRKDPVVTQLEESLKESLKAHINAWVYLNKEFTLSSPQFEILNSYPNIFIEGKSVCMEICLNLTKINANILYIEYLYRQGNLESIGRYAKSIVSQAGVIETLIAPYLKLIDPQIHHFVIVIQRLYKAIALWSLLHPYMVKIKAEKFEDGESFNKIAGACASFVDHISALHKEITSIPKFKDSPYHSFVARWFSKVMVDKCQEVAKLYSAVYKEYTYDNSHFQKIDELDYITVSTR